MKRINSASKKEYLVEANSFLYDADKNMWNLSGTGTIKAKWNGNYYLSYEKEEIKLNPQVVVFNNASRIVNLYGTIYRINEDETVDKLTDNYRGYHKAEVLQIGRSQIFISCIFYQKPKRQF